MSADKKNSSRGAVIRTKAKPKVNPTSGANFEFTGDPRIGDSFVIVIAGPAKNRSLTFHHPLGETDVDDEDWVCTPTEDIPDLLARLKDPDEKSIREKRDNYRMKLASDRKLVMKDNDQNGEIVYAGTTTSRQATVSEARKLAKEAVVGKGKPSADAYLRFIKDDSLRKAESTLREFLTKTSTIHEAELKVPSSGYRTRSGPLSDRAQKSVEYLEGMSRTSAEDAVVKRIFG